MAQAPKEFTLADLMKEFQGVRDDLSELRSENAELKEQLAAVRTRSPSVQSAVSSPPTLAPYRGWVQAMQDCHASGGYRTGPNEANGYLGDVFKVDLPSLWTDDPFRAVEFDGTTEGGKPVTRPHPDFYDKDGHSKGMIPDFALRAQVMEDNFKRPHPASQHH